jgi:hypothetical protein
LAVEQRLTANRQPPTANNLLAFSLAIATLFAASLHAQQSFPAYRFGGFADLQLHSSSGGDREGLDIVQLDLYTTVTLSDRWSALAEGVAARDLQTESEELFDLDLERLYVAYTLSDALRFELGQTHTGIVRWNEREHRSRFLQTPIDVPAIARRPQDDGAWPLRFVGLWMSGRLPGPLGVSYGAGVGGGSGRNRDQTPIFREDRSPAILLSLSMAPDALPGLEVAAAAYAQRIRDRTEPMRERDLTLSLSYVNSGTEVRAEWGRMHHRGIDSGTLHQTTGYYVLLSKRLPGRAERMRPYLLLDRLTVPDAETYLAETSDENAWALGLRYDLSRRLSMKGEYRTQRAQDGRRERLLGFQIGLAF